MACSFVLFFSPLLPLSFKAAFADFISRPNPLDTLLVSTGRRSSVRFGEVSPKTTTQATAQSTSGDVKRGARKKKFIPTLIFVAFKDS